MQLIIKSSNMDSIEVGNILELKYLNPALVEISKFPTDTGKVISLTGTSKKLILTQNGLQVKTTNLPNEFILFNFNDEEMARVTFDTGSNKLIVTSTSRVYEANDAVTFIFALVSNNGAFKRSITILQNQNADEFKNQFNDLDFEVGDIIRLIYTNRNKIKLTNYPNQGVQYTMLGLDSQSFKIIQSGIIPNLLPNDIILNGNSNNPVLTIKMDILFKMFIVTSTGSVTSPGGTNYFKATSYKADGTELASKNIPGNSNGSAFRNNFSGKKFAFGGVLKLQYEDASKVKITNFERQGQTHTPTGREEQYTITENGLVPKP